MARALPQARAVLDGIEVLVVRLDPLPEAIDCCIAGLTAAERQRAARFHSDADRRRYVAAHSMLRELLGARSGLPPESLRLESENHGKPVLAGSSLQFSLSRSGELVAYAFARGRPVGIDVEAIRPVAAAEAIAARTFPPREERAYAGLPAPAKLPGFFRAWTRTEALAKALGGGLTLPPEALEAAFGDWMVRSFAPAPGFAGAVASRRQ